MQVVNLRDGRLFLLWSVLMLVDLVSVSSLLPCLRLPLLRLIACRWLTFVRVC